MEPVISKKIQFLTNPLTHLPDELKLLVQLESLYISHNLLTSPPDIIGQLKLKELFMHGNHFKTILN